MTYELSIETPSIELELRGEREEVERMYDQVRAILLEQFQDHLESAEAPSSLPPSHETEVIETNDPALPEETRESTLEIIVYRPRYKKAHRLNRTEVDETWLGNALDSEAVHRCHMTSDVADSLESPLDEMGSTLWRHLHSETRSAVEREDREAP